MAATRGVTVTSESRLILVTYKKYNIFENTSPRLRECNNLKYLLCSLKLNALGHDGKDEYSFPRTISLVHTD